MPITGVGAGAAAAGGLVYVDRGDPAAWDKSTADFTIDGNWYNLDLSGVITDNTAVLAHIRIALIDALAGKTFNVRKDGNVNTVNILHATNTAVNQYGVMEGVIAITSTRIIEYMITSGTDNAYLAVRGWWKPAS